MPTRPDPKYPPMGCRWCGIARSQHARQWTEAAGWHAWEKPTNGQIKTRMVERHADSSGPSR
ncbi:hypothetical protein Caci_2985 [Catenulispora acidiphila DSM 44928]|uniref:Uncharacterized protein n=1 Tax=Catenulispora acidiphila (strain DSM 44928 / JCM 14897 / NBRC 102108 / NRRL B-24433 / ID139908) TaxID=479433 RepID=C7Q302_CATAD|nr:hypothetical protein Caci_2985 [Catenulispora acidiphila DSM 44928]